MPITITIRVSHAKKILGWLRSGPAVFDMGAAIVANNIEDALSDQEKAHRRETAAKIKQLTRSE